MQLFVQFQAASARVAANCASVKPAARVRIVFFHLKRFVVFIIYPFLPSFLVGLHPRSYETTPPPRGAVNLPHGMSRRERRSTSSLRLAQGRDWMKRVRELENGGCTVRSGLTWRDEAKRDEDYDEATGITLDEAPSGVAQLILAEASGHVP